MEKSKERNSFGPILPTVSATTNTPSHFEETKEDDSKVISSQSSEAEVARFCENVRKYIIKGNLGFKSKLTRGDLPLYMGLPIGNSAEDFGYPLVSYRLLGTNNGQIEVRGPSKDVDAFIEPIKKVLLVDRTDNPPPPDKSEYTSTTIMLKIGGSPCTPINLVSHAAAKSKEEYSLLSKYAHGMSYTDLPKRLAQHLKEPTGKSMGAIEYSTAFYMEEEEREELLMQASCQGSSSLPIAFEEAKGHTFNTKLYGDHPILNAEFIKNCLEKNAFNKIGQALEKEIGKKDTLNYPVKLPYETVSFCGGLYSLEKNVGYIEYLVAPNEELIQEHMNAWTQKYELPNGKFFTSYFKILKKAPTYYKVVWHSDGKPTLIPYRDRKDIKTFTSFCEKMLKPKPTKT